MEHTVYYILGLLIGMPVLNAILDRFLNRRIEYVIETMEKNQNEYQSRMFIHQEHMLKNQALMLELLRRLERLEERRKPPD